MPMTEWVSEDSPKYENILLFNDPQHPLMATRDGEKLDCLVDEAFAYVTKQDEIVIGLVPKVQFAVNMVDHPALAGEYVINKITAVDQSTTPQRFMIDHRQFVGLDTLNHIIDLNRPDVLDPQMLYDNINGFKEVVRIWGEKHWLGADTVAQIEALGDRQVDQIDEQVIKQVSENSLYLAELSQWREANWINEATAKQFAISKQPIKTIDDELGFQVSISN